MMSYDAVLIDAGTGNLHSVQNGLRSLGFNILVTRQPEDVIRPGRVILPGVGAFGHFMEGLRDAGLDEAVCAVVRRGDPLLGICVGMQALFETSAELGEHRGLGLLKGKVVRFPDMAGLKIPHTGWNQLWQRQRKSPLLRGLEDGVYAYFNHSFYCEAEKEDVAAVTDYGLDLCSSIWRENIVGVQFHPEKSQMVGKKILENFFQEKE
jgi:imidazole glycerol-phosphate synthase subunit HisH